MFGCLICYVIYVCLFFFFKQKTAYEMRISDWSSDVCSSDLLLQRLRQGMSLLGIEGEPQEAQIKTIGSTLSDAFLSKTEAIPPAKKIGRASCRERVCQYV